MATGSLSESVVILSSEGGEAAGATKNLAMDWRSTAEERDSSAPSGPQNDTKERIFLRRFSLRQVTGLKIVRGYRL
jgi:hypothetical protein